VSSRSTRGATGDPIGRSTPLPTTSTNSARTSSRSSTKLDVERVVVVSISLGAQRSIVAATRQPDRVAGLVFIAPSVPLGQPRPERAIDFDADLGFDEGWTRYNRHSWRRDYHGFLEFFFSNCFTEPHSTKQIEDAVGWGSET